MDLLSTDDLDAFPARCGYVRSESTSRTGVIANDQDMLADRGNGVGEIAGRIHKVYRLETMPWRVRLP